MALLNEQQRQSLLDGVEEAGRQVMAIYRRDFAVEIKRDESPLTEADLVANGSLTAMLQSLTPDIPVLSEESDEVPYSIRSGWARYWLIDPLDGTKEFVKKNGEFTLNVALVEDGIPVLGVVHAPVLDMTWWGQLGEGAWKRHAAHSRTISVRPLPDPSMSAWQVIGSRSHGNAEFEAFCAHLPAHERVSMGSSIKLCLVAEGQADIYPRLAPTCEWDTAAAQAVVCAAGGEVLDAQTLNPLRYNQQESVVNPFFVVCARRDARWVDALSRALALA